MGRANTLRQLSASVLALISQVIYIPVANAAGFQINEISPSLQGNATAGAAAADNDVSAMFINPATLSRLKQNQAYIGGNEILPHVKVYDASAIHTVNTPGAPPSGTTANVKGSTSQNSITKSAFIPDAYAGWRLNDNIVAGLAIVVPYGLATKYHNDSVVRFATLNSSVKSINFLPALSFKFNDRWSYGVGMQVQHLNATFSIL